MSTQITPSGKTEKKLSCISVAPDSLASLYVYLISFSETFSNGQSTPTLIAIGSGLFNCSSRGIQRDQIGRFIGLWATFQCLWQQLICPNLPILKQFLETCQNL